MVDRHRCEWGLWKMTGKCRKCGFATQSIFICVAVRGCTKKNKVKHLCLGKGAKA